MEKVVGALAAHSNLLDKTVDVVQQLAETGGDMKNPMVLFMIFMLLHAVGTEVYENREELMQSLEKCGYFGYLTRGDFAAELARKMQVAGERELNYHIRRLISRKNLERSNSKGSFRAKSMAFSQSHGKSHR